MIVIDGRRSDLAVKNFENLEQIFNKVMEDGVLEDRVVTDVLINDAPFTEIYPHQAEDIETRGIESVEIKSVPVKEMAVDITRELYKVVNLMSDGGARVAALFRQADDAEALDMYQDLLDVVRDFLGMVGSLRDEFALTEHETFRNAADEFSDLFSEMSEVLENEDWILLSDLLEYEFLPAVDRWKKVIAELRDDIRNTRKE